MNIVSIRSVAEAYAKMATEDSQNNLAATDAALAQKKQEPMDEIPSWVPGNIPDGKKKEFAEAAKKAYESDNTQFDFDGRVYKITEKLVGNQDKLDVNNNGKIDGEDLAALRAGAKANEQTSETETETPGQSVEMPEGQPHGDGDNDEDDKNDMGDEDEGDEKMQKEATEQNPTDKLTLDVPAMIRSLEKAREDFKSDEDVHNFVQGLLAKKDATIDTNALPKNEALDPKADAGEWISDFVHSKDPKFAGKSKEERKKQALAAYYQARRDAGIKEGAVNEGVANSAASWSMHARHEPSFANHSRAAEAHGKAAEHYSGKDDDLKAHHLEKQQYHTQKAAQLMDKNLGKKSESVKEGAASDAKAGLKEDTQTMKKQINENLANDMHAAHLTQKANQATAMTYSTSPEAGNYHGEAADAHRNAAEHYRVYANHAGDSGLKSVAQIHHKFHSDMAQMHQSAKGTTKGSSSKSSGETAAWSKNPGDNAVAWSKQASDNPTFANHSRAAEAHSKAATHYSNVGRSQLKAHHLEMSQHHTKKAAELMDKMTESVNEGVANTAASWSMHARHEPTFANHSRAAEAHGKAAEHYAGKDKELNSHHLEKQQYHTKKAAELMDKMTESVNEGAPADAKGGPEVMDPKTKKMKDAADQNVKAEEAPYTNKADGSENIVPANKPTPNPTPTPKLKESTKMTDSKAIKSVAQAYADLVNEAKKTGDKNSHIHFPLGDSHLRHEISSGPAQHTLTFHGSAGSNIHGEHSPSFAQHARDMKNTHDVSTSFNRKGQDDELEYHGTKKAVRSALIGHYGGDEKQAKELHPHVFGVNNHPSAVPHQQPRR